MATLTLRPTGDNSREEFWKNQAGSATNIYQSVDESSLSETDYAWNHLAYDSELARSLKFNWTDHTTESGTISQIKLYGQVKKIDGLSAGTNNKLYFFPKSYTTAQRIEVTVTTTSSLVSATWTTDPTDSSAWTWTDIDALTCGVCHYSENSSDKAYTDFYVYQMYLEVTYTPPAGWTNIAKVNGIASSSIAKVDGVAVASISKINGITV